jgi:uncharacterized protein (TIGR02421 family)
MSDTSEDIERFVSIDTKLVEIAKGVRILSRLSWPSHVQEQFLADWRRGNPRLPDITYPRASLADCIEPLRTLKRALNRAHPVARYLSDSIQSYITVCRLLENAGSPRMTAYSTELYGQPGDSLAGGRVHNIDAARHFLDIAAQYNRENKLTEGDYCLPAARIQEEMSDRLAQVFTGHTVKVVVDPEMVSKAAAGATRIRLRDATCFSEFDLEQLLQHEAFVHSLTAINGRSQARLKSMGLGAPRTTATQEGLATFAELVTGAIDISRLERIALRIIAIDMALNGGDFLDVFRFLVDAGQPENESFRSAMRVFRGAPLTGGSAFTKDTVYLHGLMEVHTFFRWCLQHGKLDLCRMLFAGRLTIGDVVRLEDWFRSGFIEGPLYLPPWVGRSNALSAYLAFSVFANHIRIQELDSGYAFDSVSELGI